MKYSVFLAGRTGVGSRASSTPRSAASWREWVPYEACTKMVDYYAHSTEYGDVCLIDTPGLAEDDGRHDATYLTMVRDRIKDISIRGISLRDAAP